MISIDIFRHDSHLQSFRANETIFERGDAGTTLYIVTEGEIVLTAGGVVLERLGPGGMFGEMALIEHKPRSATATAATDAKAAALDQKRFLYLVGNTPYFAIEVMQVMAARLRRMDEAQPSS